ncbi:MAG TPA: glutathione S-transferase N-terminal domain-containing protein [Thermoleophilia bacterium]|nr:glutathione S-transferase N-terminal domain-containing protein [Thermoleophilia bacterium]
MLTLYQAEWCPYCHRVRQVMTELELTYTCVNVPLARPDRAQVRELSGQEAVPVLKDGRKVIVGSSEIVAHLRDTYPVPDDAEGHAEVGLYRVIFELDVGPDEALAALRQALAAVDIRILDETRPEMIGSEHLPEGYVLVHAAAIWAMERAAAIDPTVPAATGFSLAVFAVEGGSAIAVTRPFAEAWLYDEPDLFTLTMAVTQRLYEALESL